MRRRFSDEEERRLAELLRAGVMTVNALAQRYRVSWHTIRAAWHRHGSGEPLPRPTPMLPDLRPADACRSCAAPIGARDYDSDGMGGLRYWCRRCARWYGVPRGGAT
jgi:hypothetical protein